MTPTELAGVCRPRRPGAARKLDRSREPEIWEKVSVITEPNVIDAILRHIARTGGRDPFEERARPAA